MNKPITATVARIDVSSAGARFVELARSQHQFAADLGTLEDRLGLLVAATELFLTALHRERGAV
jgi:hypothetical protein